MQFTRKSQNSKAIETNWNTCLDQFWRQLKRHVPKQLLSRDKTDRKENSRIETYVWSCVWRWNRGFGQLSQKGKEPNSLTKKKTLFGIEVSIWEPPDNGNCKTRTRSPANNSILG